jgi:inner membrane protein YidH
MSTTGPGLFHRPPRLPTDLGLMRTILAADRTLMAWIRTALSMLSFGFTIYKFLDAVAQQGGLPRPHSPQAVGLFLAAMGTASMVLGTTSYWTTLKDLETVEKFRLGRPVLWISLIISVAGVALFVVIAERLA